MKHRGDAVAVIEAMEGVVGQVTAANAGHEALTIS
jgi:hypothetical protein